MTREVWLPQAREGVVNVHFNAKQSFIKQWEYDKAQYTKLAFYNNIKNVFEREKYLCLREVDNKKSMVKLRGSSHRLKIETGRYQIDPVTKKAPLRREERVCNFCTANLGVKLVEDENHVIENCPYYDIGRTTFSKSLIALQDAGVIKGFSGTNQGTYFASSDDIRLCRAQSKFSNYIVTKHKEIEDKHKPTTINSNKNGRTT